ncbi:MAG: AgmX/PglI C-terminal domain-containing protein [Myxococcales bacterium]|nr:MAG: AgmX/PglI C-terminal domain-containing protein [Myxococcales bacterium]
MKRAFALATVWVLASACGGEAAPAKSAAEAAPEADAPAADAAAPASDGNDEKSAAAAAEEAWAGEGEAKAAPAPEAGGKAETRTMDVIAQVVKENRKPVRDCFEKAKKELPDLKGDMVIHFVVDPEGKVKKAELNQERSTLKSSAVVDCAVKVIQGIKFPPSSRGMDTTVNYPFNLN